MKNFSGLVKGVAIYTSASIVGPLLIFGGIGWALDQKFETGPMWLLIFVGIAFIVTNVMLFKQVQKMTGMIDELGEPLDKAQDKKEKKGRE
ncbi:AtpZ/AtpI family protein [Patescibacteria group bacterium]